MEKISATLLKAILNLPTMSFHETSVATFVRWYAAGLGLKVREDRAGNLLVTYEGAAGAPVVTFAAHMDHPGFEVIASSGKNAIVALWGKVNPKTFAGADVIVYTSAGPFKGSIGKKVLPKKHLERFCFTLKSKGSVSVGDFGHYDLTALTIKNGIIHTRAADNLISVVAILDHMTRLVGSASRTKVCGLFTRGEEAGFLGAFAAMESRLIPPKTPLIVLECSSAAGGKVDIGGGPALRAGDLQSTYDPAVDVWLSGVAESLKKDDAHFKYQRALLQGGRCEACVYVAEGYKTGGIAMPLGNYHNQGAKSYAAEFVSAEDYENLVKLIGAISHSKIPADMLKKKVAPIWSHYRSLKKKFIAST